MSEYKILKLSSTDKGTLYVIQKWVHQEKNLYGERLEQSRWGSVWVEAKTLDDAHSVTFVIGDDEEPFEILGENVMTVEEGAQYVDALVNQRRSGEDYPDVDSETLEQAKEQIESSYGMELEDEGWEQVGWRVGFRHGEVEMKQVDDVGDD